MCDLQERNYNMLHTIHKLKEPQNKILWHGCVNIANIVMDVKKPGCICIHTVSCNLETIFFADITTIILTDDKYYTLTHSSSCTIIDMEKNDTSNHAPQKSY